MEFLSLILWESSALVQQRSLQEHLSGQGGLHHLLSRLMNVRNVLHGESPLLFLPA